MDIKATSAALLFGLLVPAAGFAEEGKTTCQEQTAQGHTARLCLTNPGMFKHYQFTLAVDGEHIFTLVDDYVETVTLTHHVPQGPALEMPLSKQGVKEVAISGGCKPVLNAAGDTEIARLCNFKWGKVDIVRDVTFKEE